MRFVSMYHIGFPNEDGEDGDDDDDDGDDTVFVIFQIKVVSYLSSLSFNVKGALKGNCLKLALFDKNKYRCVWRDLSFTHYFQ